MSEELDGLIKKLQREGVEKANNEAGKIITDARTKAAEIIRAAEADAENLRAKAAKDAVENAKRSEVSLQQAARDAVLSVEKAVTDHLEKLLLKDVKQALGAPQTLSAIVTNAIKGITTNDVTLAVSSKELADALRSELAAQAAQGVTIITDETVGTGFKIRTDGGRVEHDFTGKSIAAALAKTLRPELARLVSND